MSFARRGAKCHLFLKGEPSHGYAETINSSPTGKEQWYANDISKLPLPAANLPPFPPCHQRHPAMVGCIDLSRSRLFYTLSARNLVWTNGYKWHFIWYIWCILPPKFKTDGMDQGVQHSVAPTSSATQMASMSLMASFTICAPTFWWSDVRELPFTAWNPCWKTTKKGHDCSS